MANNTAKFYRSTRSESISKVSFPTLINELYQVAFKPHHATAGFYKTGLFPLNPSEVSLNSELVDLYKPNAVESEDTLSIDQTTPEPALHSPEPALQSPEPSAQPKPKVISSIQITKLSDTAPVHDDNTLTPLEKVSQNLTSSILAHLSFNKIDDR